MRRIKKAKQQSWYALYISVFIFIMSYTLFYFFAVGVETKPISDFILANIMRTTLLISIVVSVGFLYGRTKFIWDRIFNKFEHVKSERTRHHYNLCLSHIENKKYDKALKIYNDIFKGTDRPMDHILRVALKVYNGDSLVDECLAC